MFEPVPMLRASIVVLERDERTTLRELGRLGVLQLTLAPAGPDTAPLPPPDRSRELAAYGRLAARVHELRQTLEISPISGPAGAAEISLTQAEEKISVMEKTAGDLLGRRKQLAGQAGKLATAGEALSEYRGLGIPLDPPDESSFLHFVTGSLPLGKFAAVQDEIGDNVALLPLPGPQDRQLLMVMTTRLGRPALDAVMKRSGFHAEPLPIAIGETVDTLSAANRREQERLIPELARLDTDRQALADAFASPLAEIDSAVENERRLLEAGQNFSRTARAVLITGWMPDTAAAELETRLREITGGQCALEIVAPQNPLDEQIPVLLRHPRWLRPFEILITAYGLPQYHELEPTLFVALSYVLMFGMMFGDVGHGAVLALGGLVALFAGRKRQIHDVGRLLMFAGGSSMVFGALYGSCFGITQFKKYALWHDPLEGDPLSLMTGAIGIGIVLISLGLVLNIINRLRRGDIIGGLLGKFGIAGAVFYWGALVLAANYAAVKAQGLVALAIIVFLALPVLGWTLKEPLELYFRRRAGKSVETDDSLATTFTESIVGAFEGVLSYFANTVSFVRLAAYAMSHAALLLAAFLMADAVKHFPLAGTFLSVLVIILGNAVAIALEGIVASVQALRLEYYEFFGKFFSGGGQPFKPFRLQIKTVAEAPLSRMEKI